MVSWGRGAVGGLAKGNARGLARHIFAEAGTPGTKIADLREELGGARASACRRSCGRIPLKRERQHGQVERRRPAKAEMGEVKDGLSRGARGEAGEATHRGSRHAERRGKWA